MKARYLDSRDVESLSVAMLKAARRSRQLDVAAAFLTKAGALQILQLMLSLQSRRRSQQIRVLAGTWLGVTEPSALRLLRKAPGIELRLAKTPGFHVKHISFRGKAGVVTFTGSANFTAKGLGGVGELVVEVTDGLTSQTASGERDAFRRLWEDAYPDRMTDRVIAAYGADWKPPRFVTERGPRRGKSLLERFGGESKKIPAAIDDGTVLWFPTHRTLSESTVEALEAEGGGRATYFLGLGSKSTFDRIQKGTRHLWWLDFRGGPKHRTLEYQQVLREVELATEDDGRYFAILAKPIRKISLNKRNRVKLRELGLVKNVNSLSTTEQTLRAGANSKAAKVMALSISARR